MGELVAQLVGVKGFDAGLVASLADNVPDP
jgi:hypothetical protein